MSLHALNVKVVMDTLLLKLYLYLFIPMDYGSGCCRTFITVMIIDECFYGVCKKFLVYGSAAMSGTVTGFSFFFKKVHLRSRVLYTDYTCKSVDQE
jgi:hypothetical protein